MKIPLAQRLQSLDGIRGEALLEPFSSPLQLSPLLTDSCVEDRHTPCTCIPISSWDPQGKRWAGGRKTPGSLRAVRAPIVLVVLHHPNSVALGQASALRTSELPLLSQHHEGTHKSQVRWDGGVSLGCSSAVTCPSHYMWQHLWVSVVQSHPWGCRPVLCLHEIPCNNVQLESVLVPRGAAAIRRS